VILADSSIWIEFFRSGCPEMAKQILEGQIVMHPFVVAELALGSLRDRRKTLEDLDGLPRVEVAYLDEVRGMIEVHGLYSKGIGLTDAHLLASCLITAGTQLWTRDLRLRGIAQLLNVHADLPGHAAN